MYLHGRTLGAFQVKNSRLPDTYVIYIVGLQYKSRLLICYNN